MKKKGKESEANKFLVNWGEKIPPEEMAGDSITDDLLPYNDAEENLEYRSQLPLGYPFMHPMHDATLDTYGEEGKSK
ncbi:hypothetical protein [Thermicanus aegyptius]|uniref:hypothetical protein n=1 Tax=Thermicanus aegyptius TaxID=94009 RepID=UPI00041B3FDC|nr:hypothetical protein [Thermicanus aegyptius]MBE3553811.1 hypothetical protein [Thermicanus sp.]